MILDLLNWGLKLGVVTTGLIGLVLMLRRPLARFFGADAVYLIWALPLLRVFMPDLQLPIKQAEKMGEIWPDINALTVAPPPIGGAGTAASAGQTSGASGLDLSALPFVLVSLWASVGIIWLGLQLYRHARYWRFLNHLCAPVDAEQDELIHRAADIIGLRRVPRIKTAPIEIGPMVSGLFRPLIILPKEFTDHYNADEQLYALCHEMAHIKRFDLWAALAVLCFRALHWYNPLVHYAARRVSIDQEAACDAFLLARLHHNGAAADTPHHYAKALIKADIANRNGLSDQALSLAMADKT